MHKMTSILLMTFGIIAFASGAMLYRHSGKPKQMVVNNEEQEKTKVMALNNGILTNNDPSRSGDKPEDIEKVIKMALADGVLTNNERTLIKEMAHQQALNYESIIKDAEIRLSKLKGNSETVLVNVKKKNGDDFEKHIVRMFNPKYFKIKEWAGDKYIDGKYAETTLHPDLKMLFILGENTYEFSVECKWKEKVQGDSVEFASPAQFNRYCEFERKRNIPVFIALGIGGTGEHPQDLYILPLRNIKNNVLSFSTLREYKKTEGKNLFFDFKSQILR